MSPVTNDKAPARYPGRLLLLSQRELRTRYADALAEANLIAGLLRLAERIGRRRGRTVLVPVRVERTQGDDA